MRHRISTVLLLSTLLAGCEGIILDHAEPGDDVPPAAAASEIRVWRLNHDQYDRTVRDLLGDDSQPAQNFEPEASGTGFVGGADVSYVSTTLADQYMNAAELLAQQAVTDLDSLLPCSPADPNDEACVRKFILEFGTRAFRQPVTAEQEARYVTLYESGRSESPTVGVQLVIEAMLQSPYFLYRTELGAPDAPPGIVRLTSPEIAAQLSYHLWGTMPDDELLELAIAGGLDNDSAVVAEVDRMLADPRARLGLGEFFSQVFRVPLVASLDKDPDLFPNFTPDVAAALETEARSFIDAVAWDENGTLNDLLTADYSFIDPSLAEFYGVEAPSSDGFERVTFPPGQRSGLLTHAGLLAVLGSRESGSPTQRGYYVRQQLLCQSVPEPPANVVDTIEPPTNVLTTRDRYEEHIANGDCVGCHKLMDPIGFGLENFDGAGRFRTEENGEAIDASGELIGTAESNGPFLGPIELGQRLASAPEVDACITTNFFRYALGRREVEADAAALSAFNAAFREAGKQLVALPRLISASPSALYRVKP